MAAKKATGKQKEAETKSKANTTTQKTSKNASTKTKVKEVKASKSVECHDKNCPFHGTLRVRGRTFVGKVIRAKMQKTVTISIERVYKIKKFERYAIKTYKLKAHVPDCLEVREGDVVKIGETRPISKTKHFVVVEVLKRD